MLTTAERETLCLTTTTPIYLEVKRAHIDQSYFQHDCVYCPIELAFMEVAPGAEDVHVSDRNLSFKFDGESYEAPLAFDAREFITTFDNGDEASPFFTEIELPTRLVETPGFLADGSHLEMDLGEIDREPGGCPL